jgi:hypothetical protein
VLLKNGLKVRGISNPDNFQISKLLEGGGKFIPGSRKVKEISFNGSLMP